MRAAPSRTALPLSLFKQVVDGGGSALNAQEIRAALDANPTLGSVNVDIELDRQYEPGTGQEPKSFKGIDSMYHREYEYDACGRCTHVLLQQHFQVGQGQRVATSTLRALWRDEEQFEALVTELKPKKNEPRNGVRAASAKRKRSEEQEEEKKQERRLRRHEKQLKQFYKKCEDEAAARALAARRTAFCCQFSAHGCKFPPFLQEARAKTHAAKYCVFNPLHEKHGWVKSAHVKATVKIPELARRVKERGRIAWLIWLHVTQGGHVSARVLPKQVATRERRVVVHLRVRPGLNPDEQQRRGLQKYRVLPTAAISVISSTAAGVASDDATHVMLPVLAAGDRQPPEIATEGWTLRGPTIRTRKTPEQNELLLYLYNHMPRLND